MNQLAFDLPVPQKRVQTILVVDDEVSIRRTLTGVLQDEGYQVLCAEDGASGLQLIRDSRPSLVLLDIWMPGMDGIETLKAIKKSFPEIPVIMISGHATIATAVMATRIGADDFIEKPLDLNTTLQSVRRSLQKEGFEIVNEEEAQPEATPTGEVGFGDWIPADINPVVFSNQAFKGKKIRQRTLARSAIMYGQGLHSGKKSGLVLEPLPADSGIHFVGVSEPSVVPAHVDFVQSTGFATTLKLGRTNVATIEHLMSALHAYGISNLLIKCNGEVPVMDGSSRPFCSLIEETGTEEQDGNWYEIEIKTPIQVGNENEYIRLEPGEGFTIDYTLDYPDPLGIQHFVFTLGDIEAYKREIAPARTFGFVKDIGALQKAGLALGGRFDNFVLMGAEGAINDKLRFDNEAVRHKILDAIGDLYLLGRPIKGKVTARMTGHSDNIALLQALKREMLK